MIGSSVAASLLGTSSIKKSPVWRSTPPKTHWAGTGRPCGFPGFRLATTVSLIATVCPRPPSCCGLARRSAEHTSRKKLAQSITVLWFTFSYTAQTGEQQHRYAEAFYFPYLHTHAAMSHFVLNISVNCSKHYSCVKHTNTAVIHWFDLSGISVT